MMHPAEGHFVEVPSPQPVTFRVKRGGGGTGEGGDAARRLARLGLFMGGRRASYT